MTPPSSPNAPDTGATSGGSSGFSDVVAEIVAETERRRRSGKYPPELLERLDSEFDRFAPLSFRRTGVEGAIRAVESAAFVSADAPIEGTRKSVRAVKTAVKKTTGWYHLHTARQVTALGIQITRPLRMLHESIEALTLRVAEIENAVDARSTHLTAMVEALANPALSEEATDVVLNMFEGRAGRVVHLGARDPALVLALVHSGVDAYGVTPGGGGGLEVEIRPEGALRHLRDLPVASLAGVVVTGIGDTGSISDKVELCRLMADRVEPGGRIVIVTREPDEWENNVGPIAADLVGSRPLHSETWIHLLTRAGTRAPRVESTVDALRIIVSSAS